MIDKDCDRGFEEDCDCLGDFNQVRELCERACQLARRDIFLEAEQYLQEAARFVNTRQEQGCLDAYQEYIQERRADRIRILRKKVQDVLDSQDEEITQDVYRDAEDALIVLKNLVEHAEAQRWKREWWRWRERRDIRLGESRAQAIEATRRELIDELVALLRKEPKNLTQADLQRGPSILARLEPIHPNPQKVQQWIASWNQQLEERKKVKEEFDKMIEQTDRLIQQKKFQEAGQVLNDARALADRNGKRRIRRRERKIEKQKQLVNQYLEEANQLAAQDHFPEALAELREARKLPFLGEKDRARIEALEQEIHRSRLERVHILTNELISRLDKEPGELTREDLDEIQKALAMLQSIHPCPSDLEPLIEGWLPRRDRALVLLDLEEARQELEEIWQAASPLQLEPYNQALGLAQQKASAYPDEPLAQESLGEAQTRREEAYEKASTLTSQAEMGNFGALIAELERLYEQGVTELPQYSWDQRTGITLTGKSLPARQAIDHLKSLARKYNDREAGEYIERAQGVLMDSPSEARRWLEQAMTFDYLSSAKREELDHFLKEFVIPAQERHQRALNLAATAREGHRKDPITAWKLVREAKRLMPDLLEVTQAQDYLLPWLRVHLDGLLRQADEAFEGGDYKEAARLAYLVLDNVSSTPSLFERAFQKAQTILQNCREKGIE